MGFMQDKIVAVIYLFSGC